MSYELDPGSVEIVFDRHGVLLVDSRDVSAGSSGAWPTLRFTHDEWDEFLDRANTVRPRT